MKKFNITVNGTTYEVIVEEIDAAAAPKAATAPTAAPAAAPVPPAPAPDTAPTAPAPAPAAPAVQTGSEGALKITCPMPGTIVKLNYSAGQTVKRGDVLCLFEAMKMENEIMCPQDGVVASVNVTVGQTVNAGDLLLR